MRHAGFLAAALLAFAGNGVRAGDDVLVVKAGRLIPVAGEELRDAIVVIRGGRIEAVGKGLEIPPDARILDASDKTVLPGFIEAHSFRGVDRPNENLPSVPYVSTFDSVNPLDPYFEESLRQGITTIFLSPGNATMIGGRGCVLRPAGVTTEAMTVVRDHALKISLAPRPGMTRMAHLALLRRELDGLLDHLKELEEKKGEVPTAGTGGGRPATEIEVKREVLARFLQGKLPAFVYCPTAVDVLRAIELSKAYQFRMKLVLGRETWRAAADIAAAKLEVVLPPDMIFWETDEEKHEEVLRVLPAIFSKAGVKFCFQTDSSTLGSSYLWYQAAAAVRHGMPRDKALRTATLDAAEILGLGTRLGSLEKGKDGNLVILTGDPLDTQTWVDQVVIEGKPVYSRADDAKLKRLAPGKK